LIRLGLRLAASMNTMVEEDLALGAPESSPYTS
jgi:hypothetical protein